MRGLGILFEFLRSDLFERKLEEIVAKVQNPNTEEKKENETFSLVSLEKKKVCRKKNS